MENNKEFKILCGAIESGNTDLADIMVNDLCKENDIEINTRMPESFVADVKKKNATKKRRVLFNVLKAAIISLIVSGTLFTGVYYKAQGKNYRNVYISINDEKVDPTQYVNEDGNIKMDAAKEDKVEIVTNNIKGNVVVYILKDGSKHIISTEDSLLKSIGGEPLVQNKYVLDNVYYSEIPAGEGTLEGENLIIRGDKKVGIACQRD